MQPRESSHLIRVEEKKKNNNSEKPIKKIQTFQIKRTKTSIQTFILAEEHQQWYTV